MQAVILAAGRGTRLRPVSEHRSKAMMPAAGKPLVERVLDTFDGLGIEDLILVIGPEDRLIQEHFAGRRVLGVRPRFVVQHERRGMAHALAIAAPLLRGDFVLSACDSLCPASHLAELLGASASADGVLSLRQVSPEAVSRSAAVVLEGDEVRRIVEKPRPEESPSTTVSLPLYVLPPRLLSVLGDLQRSPRGEYELQDAIQILIGAGSRFVGVHTPWRRQVSSVDDLLALNRWLLATGRDALQSPPGDAVLNEPIRIDPEVEIGPGCTLGPNLYLERGCRIGAGAVLRDAVVMSGSAVGAGALVEDQVVVPQG